MTTKTVNLGLVLQAAMSLVKPCLAKCAEKASVNICFHERLLTETPQVELTVDVWSENEGSVADYCSFYLAQLVNHAFDFNHVQTISTEYRQRIANWLKSQNM